VTNLSYDDDELMNILEGEVGWKWLVKWPVSLEGTWKWFLQRVHIP